MQASEHSVVPDRLHESSSSTAQKFLTSKQGQGEGVPYYRSIKVCHSRKVRHSRAGGNPLPPAIHQELCHCEGAPSVTAAIFF